MNFDDLARMMTSKYKRNARQLQVQNLLENLHLERSPAENDSIGHSESLTKLMDTAKV